MQTQKMFHAMALSWATALSLAVVAVCFAGPETPSTGNTSTGNTQAADTSVTAASDDTTGGITAGDYKQADDRRPTRPRLRPSSRQPRPMTPRRSIER